MTPAAEGWGQTDVRKHTWWQTRGIYLHVYRGDDDVTDRCRFFDDTSVPPVAELYRLDAHGRKYRDATGPGAAVERIHDFRIVREDRPPKVLDE